MAKSGFSVSQRRKVQNITGADPVAITAADCGTMFVITDDGTGRAGARAISLPATAAAGNGWHCKIVLGVAQGNAGQDTVITAPENFAARLIVANDGDGSVAIITDGGAATLTFDASAADAAGDQVEIMVLNGSWYAFGHSNA